MSEDGRRTFIESLLGTAVLGVAGALRQRRGGNATKHTQRSDTHGGAPALENCRLRLLLKCSSPKWGNRTRRSPARRGPRLHFRLKLFERLIDAGKCLAADLRTSQRPADV